MYTTYSFEDVAMTISHPSYGQSVANGAGLGNISTSMTQERTSHEVAADGSIMVSKIKGRNGSHTIQVQQTSSLNKWLLNLYNYLEQAPTNEWAQMTLVVRAPNMQDLISSTGVSFQKLPDRPYEQQGQMITWTLMAADVSQQVV